MIGQLEGIVLEVDFGNQDVFSEPSRDNVRLSPGFALHMVAPPAVMADHTGSVVVDKDPVAGPERCDAASSLNDLSRRLMAEDQGGLFLDIPLHHITGADTTGPGLH